MRWKMTYHVRWSCSNAVGNGGYAAVASFPALAGSGAYWLVASFPVLRTRAHIGQLASAAHSGAYPHENDHIPNAHLYFCESVPAKVCAPLVLNCGKPYAESKARTSILGALD